MATRKSSSLPPARAAQGTVPGVLEQLVGFTLRRVNQRMVAHLSSQLSDLELRPHQFTALSIVVDNPGIIQSALAGALGVERSNLVDLVDDLETRGLLTRNPVEGDRRSYALHPTPAGIRFRTKTLAVVQRHEAEMLAGLTKSEREQLLSLLHRIESD